MSCERCIEAQRPVEPEVFVNLGHAEVGLVGCPEHVREAVILIQLALAPSGSADSYE